MNEELTIQDNLMNNEEQNTKVFTQTKDLPISTIKDMFDEGDIIPQPTYQRDYVMDDKQASKLIESILIQIPIPTVYLCEENDGRLSVIDGQQRMTSIVRFLKNEFALKGLEELKSLNKKYFKDLDKVMQRTIKTTTLNSIVILKESQELKYEIFARLNQGSTKLKPQELRNCIYRGPFNEMLEELAKNPLLKILYREENKRKNYQEYILRFFALRNVNDYGSSLKKTFNDYMSKHQNDSEEDINQFKKLFNSTMDIIKQVFGDTAFTAWDRQNNKFLNTFSGSVYDSIAVACSMFDSHDLMAHSDEIRKQINEIKMNNLQYQDYTYASSGSKNRVVGRIMLIYNTISNIIGKPANGEVQRTFTNDDKETLWHDGYVCSYCGQQILSIDDAEVDHINAYSTGGETTLENAQLLHRHCNREKSDKVQEIDTVDFEDEDDE